MFPAESSRLLLREEATESRLRRQAIAQYRILSFATHGLIKGDIESLAEAALVLTPESDRDTQRDGLWVIAPRRRAVAMACSPATPAPSAIIFAGLMLPAA